MNLCMIVSNLFSIKILGSFIIMSFIASFAFCIDKSNAQEEFESEVEEPAFKIINIPNEGILTVENDTSYKEQLTMPTPNQSAGPKDLGNQISLAGREDGSIVLADTGSHKIQKFDSNGTLLSSWGSTGMADGQFLGDIAVSVGPQGTILVADSGSHKIQKFDSNGTLLSSWGSTGMADGQFLGDIAVSVGPQGTILVADSGSHKIQKFDSNGTLLSSWKYANETVSQETVTPTQGELESGEEEGSVETSEKIIAPQSSSSSSSSSTPEPVGVIDTDASSESPADSLF